MVEAVAWSVKRDAFGRLRGRLERWLEPRAQRVRAQVSDAGAQRVSVLHDEEALGEVRRVERRLHEHRRLDLGTSRKWRVIKSVINTVSTLSQHCLNTVSTLSQHCLNTVSTPVSRLNTCCLNTHFPVSTAAT